MLRSRIIWHRSQKRRILCGRSATTSRGVLEAYSSQKPQSATVRLSIWKGAPGRWRDRIMRRERPNNALGWWCPSALSCSVFLNRTFENAEIRCLVWKQTEAHWSIAAAKRMNWKWSQCGVTANLAIWKGYKFISLCSNCHYNSSIGLRHLWINLWIDIVHQFDSIARGIF